jgi:ribose 5-phosphate isomerase A
MSLNQEEHKKQAAHRAVEEVRSGMSVGLGHGSTVIHAVRRLARLVSRGRLEDITCVPCTNQVAEEAAGLGLALASLEEYPALDLTIDGADEVDPHLNLIKGGGGALLREKILAQNSRREIIIVDETKLSPALGTRFDLPVEAVYYGIRPQVRFLASLGAQARVRLTAQGRPFRTDQGNVILDCRFGPLEDPAAVARALAGRAGLVEHGLFIGLATEVVVAGQDGVMVMTR